jgi:MFS transporter, OFA family, oxalate/formate antiporter
MLRVGGIRHQRHLQSPPMTTNRVPLFIIPRLPFFYGWVVLACVCCAAFARQGPAVATLSIFIDPMTTEFGWSRTAISGAVSLGGLLAAITAPYLGTLLDRHGARMMLMVAVFTTALSTALLSATYSLVMFYILFCYARMNFAGPFDLGIYGAINNWFIKLRGTATSVTTLFLMIGLIAMPLIAQTAIVLDGWRTGWLAVGATVLIIGFLPNWLLMVRRPEDVGLVPDGALRKQPEGAPGSDANEAERTYAEPEPAFTRPQALRTSAFWLLALYTALAYPIQAGVSLHQAPHLIERGIDPTIAATIVSTFSLFSAISGVGLGLLARRIPTKVSLAFAALCLAGSSFLMISVDTPALGYLSAALFGIGIGGVLTLLPIAWADYFGRKSFGAIRGVALSIQVIAQATGPLISGVLRDMTGNYTLSLELFAAVGLAAAFAALLVKAPAPPRS